MLITVVIICYLATMGVFLIPTKKNTPTNDYSTLMGILDERITYIIRLKNDEYQLNEIRLIPDSRFKDEVQNLTKDVMSSLAKPFLNDLYYYHPREFIIKYIASHMRQFIVEYTKVHKYKTK